MRRILALVFSLQLSVISLLAADITPQEALDIANQFVQKDKTAQQAIRRAPAGTKIAPTIAHKMPSRVNAQKDNVYIINLGDDQGFVIVAGESGAISDILGYCDHGSFSYEDAPVQFLDLLKEYSDGIDSLRQDPSLARAQLPAHMKKAYPNYLGNMIVEPLLTTAWNQWAPYNDLCPVDDSTNVWEGPTEYHGHCPSGCVPTAVAQVMRYWKWPKQSGGRVIVGYTDGGTTPVYEDFPVHTYDWDNMLDYYGYTNDVREYMPYQPYNSAQAHAVAQLMADVGKAMGTSYCQPNGSPAGLSAAALVDNFGYEPGHGVINGSKASKVKEGLKAELDENRPVLYRGQPLEGDGHALVCDGYTSNDYFHFNYGWGGDCNGFYLLGSIPIYIYNVQILTNVRPYDATRKIINGIEYGLRPNGQADILDYTLGGTDVNNGALIIPDSVYDEGIAYAVTRICQKAFFRKGNFTKMVIGNNIEAIDAFSFFYTKIDTLVLSDKMVSVPDEAFQETSVKRLVLGANIRRIGKRAFAHCPLTQGIICNSPAVELDEEAFFNTQPAIGSWVNSITHIGKKAFAGARFKQWVNFLNLEVIGDSAFYATAFGNSTPSFRLQTKVREVAPSAFDGWTSAIISVEDNNPYFSADDDSNLYNKNKSSLVLARCVPATGWPATLVKMEKGCFRASMHNPLIPATVVDMEGALMEVVDISNWGCVCLRVTPPEVTDETFNDTIFANPEQPAYLYVPAGTEDLYRKARGWRRFGDNIIGDQPFAPMDAPGVEYLMVVRGDSLQANVATKDIASIRVSEPNGTPTVTMALNGGDTIITPTSGIDSITWKPTFLFENAETHTITQGNPTVETQKCSVTFAPTTFDDSVQIAIRNSVLVPRPSEGVTRGIGIDISMLTDTGEVHQLSGVATITIPYSVGDDEVLCAAYYNEKTGEWDPVYVEYDKQAGTATIMTDHLSLYALYNILAHLGGSKIKKDFEKVFEEDPECYETLRKIPALYVYTEAIDILCQVLSSDSPDLEQALKFKDDMGLWQTVGLDGFYNGVVSITESMWNFKPEAIDNAVNFMGKIGMAMNIVDLCRAEFKEDDTAVRVAQLKYLMNKALSKLTTTFGTPTLSASMCLVAFVGVALEHFGTTVQEYKIEYYRAAYKYYYSIEGYNKVGQQSYFKEDLTGKPYPHSYFRTIKDWYDYFYPAFTEGKMNDRQLQAYIEQSVRMYCDRFWDEWPWVQTEIFTEVEMRGYTHYYWEPAAMKKQLSDEHFAELMNGYLVPVFTSLLQQQKVKAYTRLMGQIKPLAEFMNTELGFRIMDNSWQEGDTSKYAGWTVAFEGVPDSVAASARWRNTLNYKGRAGLGLVTIHSMVENEIPTKVTLYDPEGKPQRRFEFQISETIGKQIFDIDISTGGVIVDDQPIDGLELTYEPPYVEVPYTYLEEYEVLGSDRTVLVPETHEYYLYIEEPFSNFMIHRRARLRTEIERYFNRHAYITVDSLGNYTIGEDLVGKLVNDTASGSFVINTAYKFVEQTPQQFVSRWNDTSLKWWERMFILLNGTMSHQIACQYQIKRIEVDDHYEYEITYTGEGAFDLTANFVSAINKLIDGYMVIENNLPKITLSDIETGLHSVGGDVTLEYKTTLR